MRNRCIAAREALPVPARAAASARIEAGLARLLLDLAPRRLGFCWPYKGEVDPTALVARWLAGDGERVAALPVILGRRAPMAFRRWTPGCAMVPGPLGIPLPEEGAAVHPEAFLLPVVAFDEAGFRLGYGGGYFDRTLAALEPRPLAVGVGFELARIDSIRPQPHDAPLDYLVTEAGVWQRSGRQWISWKPASQPRNSL